MTYHTENSNGTSLMIIMNMDTDKDTIDHPKRQKVWKENLFIQMKIAPHLDLV